MTIQENITRIANAKTALRTSIENKGVSVDTAALIDTYSLKVNEIPQGTQKVNWTGKVYFTYTNNGIKYYLTGKAGIGFSRYFNNCFVFNNLNSSSLGLQVLASIPATQQKVVGVYDITIKTGEIYVSLLSNVMSWDTVENSPFVCISEDETTTLNVKSVEIIAQDVMLEISETQDIEIQIAITQF